MCKSRIAKDLRGGKAAGLFAGVSVILLLGGPWGSPPAAGAEESPKTEALNRESKASSAVPPEERGRLVEAFNRWAAGLRTVKAGGKAWVGAEGEKTRAFRFSIVLARPGSARLQGRLGSLATLFDLAGDGSGWVLYLPQDRMVVRSDGDPSPGGLLLPPKEIISVLLPEGIPPRDLETRGTADREGDLVRLVIPPGQGGAGSAYHRVIRLAGDGTPRVLEIRRETQLEVPILVARYQAFEGKGRDAFPVDVRVDLPEFAQWARFSFETVRVNAETSPDLFHVNVPEGTREVLPGDLTPDFLPEAEDP